MKYATYTPVKHIYKISCSFELVNTVIYQPVKSEYIANIYIGQIPTKIYKTVKIKYNTSYSQVLTRAIHIYISNNLTKIHIEKIANYDLKILNYDGGDIYINTEFISNTNQWTRRRR